MIRRPPRSTLFPSRRSSDLASSSPTAARSSSTRWPISPRTQPKILRVLQERSEEHTSELQSLAYLVCRLLLEKKNNRAIPATSGYLTDHLFLRSLVSSHPSI